MLSAVNKLSALITALTTVVLAVITYNYMSLTRDMLNVQKDPSVHFSVDVFKDDLTILNRGEPIKDISIYIDAHYFQIKDAKEIIGEEHFISTLRGANVPPIGAWKYIPELKKGKHTISLVDELNRLDVQTQLSGHVSKVIRLRTYYYRAVDSKEYTFSKDYEFTKNPSSAYYFLTDIDQSSKHQPKWVYIHKVKNKLSEF